MKFLNKNKKLRYTLILILISIAVLLAAKHHEAYRLYKVITLFDEDTIAENFQNMSRFFPATTVKKGPKNFTFSRSSLTMPDSFSFKGENQNIQTYLDATYTTGFLVIANNEIVFENYYRGFHVDGLHISWSVNKSFVSALVGIAIKDGLIENIQDPIDKYVPELTNSGYAGVSIENILQMSSGVAFRYIS